MRQPEPAVTVEVYRQSDAFNMSRYKIDVLHFSSIIDWNFTFPHPEGPGLPRNLTPRSPTRCQRYVYWGFTSKDLS
jgi:hypothetical protein